MGMDLRGLVVRGVALVIGLRVSLAAALRVSHYRNALARAELLLEELTRRPEVVVCGDCSQLLSPGTKPEQKRARMASLARKLATILAGGWESLGITTDFDRTVSSAGSMSSHGVLESFNVLDEAYRREAAAVSAKYYPIETDPKLSISEKLPHMKAWYQANHAAMSKQHIHRTMIRRAVQEADVQLRPRVRQVIRTAQERSVPLLVFSAGLADVIEEVLVQQFGRLAPSTQVIGNRMLWDGASGMLHGFSEPTIHMFNKNQSQVPQRPDRPHEILLGDSVGDVTMCDGASNPPSHVLKIGFLNTRVDEHLEKYEKIYDILILNDGDMEPVCSVLEEVDRLEQQRLCLGHTG